jgi:hypothetical protein
MLINLCHKRPQTILSIEDTAWTPSRRGPVGACIYGQALGYCERSLITSRVLRRRRPLRKHGRLSITTFWAETSAAQGALAFGF